MIKITEIKTNPNNPRLIKDEKFAKLVKSINEFPKMMELRPLVVNADNVILGGNMRFKALKELGYTNIPKEWVKRADELTEDETRRFIIADNVGFGEHDWDLLANDWDSQELNDWGLDVWQPETEVDYSILDEEDLSSELSDMTDGVKKAIQIEFEAEHYEEAQHLVKFWRDSGAYIGAMIIEFLKSEKDKL